MKLVLLLLGLVFLTACNGEFPVDLPPFPGSDDTAASSKNPTAGHAITPNPFYPRSVEWLWDPQGVYLLASGSSIAREILNEQSIAVANVQGMAYSAYTVPNRSEPDYHVWMWTPLSVFRYEPTTQSLLQVRDAAANELSNVQEIITFPGPVDNTDEVWLWTPDNFFRLTSYGPNQAAFVANSRPIAGIQAIKPSPDVRYVFLWTTTALFLYDRQTESLHDVLNPVGSFITGIQGIWLEPIVPPESTEQFFTLLIWNDIDLYQLQFPTTSPFRMEKVVNNGGGGINEVRGIARTMSGRNAFRLWAWTPNALYRLPAIPGERAENIPLTIDGIKVEQIIAAASCHKEFAPLYLWSESHLVMVNTGTPVSTRLMARSDGLITHNKLRQVIPCVFSQSGRVGLPDEVWWWDDSGVYRQVMIDGPATPILAPNRAYLTQVRGMMVGLYQNGQEIWLWNDAHVYQYLPDSNETREMSGPNHQPLANTWMIQMRPEPNEPTTGYTILIRNSQNVYQYMVGNEYAMPITVGEARKAIGSPPYAFIGNGVVMIGQSAHLSAEEMEGLFSPQLNTVLRFSEDAAAIIDIGSGHCNGVTQDC